jgi:hypothetical protein
MHMMCLTRTISIEARPETVISLLCDARQLPNWAPRFARRVLPEGGQWVAEADDGTRIPVAFRASREHGTVDVLVTQAPPRGAYMRVLGNGSGSELILSVMFPGDAAAIARQRRVADDELRAVRDLAEGRTRAPAEGRTQALAEGRTRAPAK